MKTSKAREIVNTLVEELLEYGGIADAWEALDDLDEDTQEG